MSIERTIELVGQAEMLLDEATDEVPEGTDDADLWRAIELLTDWLNRQDKS